MRKRKYNRETLQSDRLFFDPIYATRPILMNGPSAANAKADKAFAAPNRCTTNAIKCLTSSYIERIQQ